MQYIYIYIYLITCKFVVENYQRLKIELIISFHVIIIFKCLHDDYERKLTINKDLKSFN